MTDSTVTPSSVRSPLSDGVPFVDRHVGPGSDAVARMLAAVGYDGRTWDSPTGLVRGQISTAERMRSAELETGGPASAIDVGER